MAAANPFAPPDAPTAHFSLLRTIVDYGGAGGSEGIHAVSLPARGATGEARQASFPASGPASQPEKAASARGEKDVWGDGRAQERGGGRWGWSRGSSGLCRSRCQSCRESARLLGHPLPALPKARSRLGSLGATSLGHGASGFPEPRPPGLQGAGLRNSGFPSVFSGFPFPLRDYPEIFEGPFQLHREPILQNPASFPLPGTGRILLGVLSRDPSEKLQALPPSLPVPS